MFCLRQGMQTEVLAYFFLVSKNEHTYASSYYLNLCKFATTILYLYIWTIYNINFRKLMNFAHLHVMYDLCLDF
jgi:hypothetical protein